MQPVISNGLPTYNVHRFQAFISGAIILHIAAQQKIHKFEEAEWRSTLAYAVNSLDILKSCGPLDQVAARFYEQLNVDYGAIIEGKSVPDEGDDYRNGTTHVDSTSENESFDRQSPESLQSSSASPRKCYLLNFPPNASSQQQQLSLRLFRRLCRPYDSFPMKPSEI
jgi:hypothetical protein